jgi:hypothetical protein
LAGRPPISTGTVAETLRRVQESDFPPTRRVNRHVPATLDAVCTRAMARKPADRYAAALDLAADFERWLADEPVSAFQEPLSARVRRWARRHRHGSTKYLWTEEAITEKVEYVVNGQDAAMAMYESRTKSEPEA